MKAECVMMNELKIVSLKNAKPSRGEPVCSPLFGANPDCPWLSLWEAGRTHRFAPTEFVRCVITP